MSSLIAAMVLAGGRSRRLGGEDKALIEVAGRTMLDRVLSAMLDAGADPVVVVGPHRDVSAGDVVFTAEGQPGGGPVPAVAAGLRHAGVAEIVVLGPVDVPLLGGADVNRLVAGLVAEPDVGVVAAADHRRGPNPLLAAYRRPVLDAALRRNAARAGAAAACLLDGARVVVVDLADAALNVNSPADLAAARDLAGASARRSPR